MRVRDGWQDLEADRDDAGPDVERFVGLVVVGRSAAIFAEYSSIGIPSTVVAFNSGR
jgi:hypothetical protein